MPEQNVTNRYLRRQRLLSLLQELFPRVNDFNLRIIEDQWLFEVPRIVTDAELDMARD
ncbi:hypothetical protein BJX63DRAFT_239090 [Aspergillus granulosus]|uniref:Uncharacterized protein n=1 Tax=Aspergillus granulosus TaxID=176169 RepID=A0ABR4HBD3_9EURO